MKAIKYTAVAAMITFSLSACRNSSDSKTLGGTTDTADVTAGSNAGNGSNPSSLRDTAKSSGTDSTSHGNASPTGHMTADTTKTRKL